MASAGQLSCLGTLPERFLRQGATAAAAAAGRQHSSCLTTAGPCLLGGDGLRMLFAADESAGADPATSSHPQVAQSRSAVAAAMHLPPGSTLADHLVNERHVQPRFSNSLGQVLAQGWPQGLAPAQSAAASLPWLPPIDPWELEARQAGAMLAGGTPQGRQEVGGTRAAAAGNSTEGRQQGSAEAGHNMLGPVSASLTRHLEQEQRQTGVPQAQSRGVPCRDGAARPEGAFPCPAATAPSGLPAAQQASCPACPACNLSSVHVFLGRPVEQPGPSCATCLAQLAWHTPSLRPTASGTLALQAGLPADHIVSNLLPQLICLPRATCTAV